jgi:hypothetical protein
MNAELEALIKALQATLEARGREETDRMDAIYASRLEDAAERLGVSKEFLETAVMSRHRKWVQAQNKHSTIPPKA